MKFSFSALSLRLACGTAVAAAGLLSAPGAFAQTASPFTFQVVNSTASSGDPVFSVTDNLTFTNLQINETFASGFSQILLLNDLVTATTDPVLGGSEFSDKFIPNSILTSAVLTGSIATYPGQTMQTVDLATDFSGSTTPQYVSSTFSASLFGPAQTGTALGVFSFNNGPNGVNVLNSVNIVTPAAVPEASTTVSLGLLLALGLGGLAVSRRRAFSAK